MRKLLMAASLTLVLPPTLQAQTQLPNPGLQIQFAPPGARALGMGATFVAVADDATAAASNPAGLIILGKPEVSGQVRYSNFTTPSAFGPDNPDSDESIGSVSFLSFVYPTEKFAVGVYYQQPTNFEASSQASWTYFDEDIGVDVNEAVTSSQSVKFENLGASFALKLAKQFSVGGSVRATRVSRASSFSYSWAPVLPTNPSVKYTDMADGTPTKVSFDIGVLANPNGRWSFGANYSYGPTVDIGRSYRVDRTGFLVNPPDYPATEQGEDETSPFNVPDTLGAGIAFRPTDKWVLSAEVLGIKYSDLESKALPGEEDVTRLEFPDRAEFHVGGEYTLMAGNTPVSLRAGYYYDPDHDGVGDQDGDGTEDLQTTQHHVTFGGGFVVNGKFQMDFAANIAKYVKEALVSVVLRF